MDPGVVTCVLTNPGAKSFALIIQLGDGFGGMAGTAGQQDQQQQPAYLSKTIHAANLSN
jgi:hypothetical protein